VAPALLLGQSINGAGAPFIVPKAIHGYGKGAIAPECRWPRLPLSLMDIGERAKAYYGLALWPPDLLLPSSWGSVCLFYGGVGSNYNLPSAVIFPRTAGGVIQFSRPAKESAAGMPGSLLLARSIDGHPPARHWWLGTAHALFGVRARTSLGTLGGVTPVLVAGRELFGPKNSGVWLFPWPFPMLLARGGDREQPYAPHVFPHYTRWAHPRGLHKKLSGQMDLLLYTRDEFWR